jgi:hypothetical protein
VVELEGFREASELSQANTCWQNQKTLAPSTTKAWHMIAWTDSFSFAEGKLVRKAPAGTPSVLEPLATPPAPSSSAFFPKVADQKDRLMSAWAERPCQHPTDGRADVLPD